MIQKKCKKALRLVEDLRVAYILKDLSKVNKILKQMDKIDSIITENKSTISLIEYLLYIADYNALTSKKVDSDNPSIKEADIILEQSRNYYNEIKNALSGSQKYIDEALEKVKNLDDMEI